MLKLTGVNLILRKSGSLPVPTLDTGGRSQQAEAERCLDEEELRIQAKGWHYNQRGRVELTADSNGRVIIPVGVISIDSDYWDGWRDVTQLGDALYDLWENTDQFSGTLRAGYTLRYEFECIPEEIATYIVVQAAQTYYENLPMRDMVRLRGIMRDCERARDQAKAFNARIVDSNILWTSQARGIRGGRGNGYGHGAGPIGVPGSYNGFNG